MDLVLLKGNTHFEREISGRGRFVHPATRYVNPCVFLSEIVPASGERFGCTQVHERKENYSRPDHVAHSLTLTGSRWKRQIKTATLFGG